MIEATYIIRILIISLVSIWLTMAVLVLILLSTIEAAIFLEVRSLALIISIIVWLVVEVRLPLVAEVLAVSLL